MNLLHSIKERLTILLVIIALITLVIMGIYIYKTTIVKKDTLDSSNSNIIEENNILESEEAEKMAKKILDEYMKLCDYENSNVGPMPYILVELGLETYENIDLLTSGINDSSTYIKSNTKYEKFKEKLLQYVTENYFLERFSQYKNIDGYVGFCNCACGTIPVEVENIILNSVNGNEYTFNIVLKDMQMYEHYLNPENGENITEDDYLFNIEICFKYVNNKLVISQW